MGILDDPSYRWTNQRVRTPTVLQMEAAECGAAALAMVLGYHGRPVPLEQLRVDCGVSRDGSKASNILLAARKYGLVAKGYRHDVEQLHGLPLPQVLFWNFNHFVVLEGIRGKRIHLNDPATGPRTVTSEELEDAFTGVVLAFEPGPEFRPGGHRPRLLTALAERLAGYRDALLFALLAGLALVVPGLVVPTFSRVFVDSVLIEQDLSWSGPLLLSMGAVALLLIALTWFQQTVLLRFQVKLSLVSSAAFFQHVLRLPMEFFAQRFGGEVGNRIQYNDRVAQLLSGDLATNAISVLMILFYPLLMVQYDALLTLLGISIAAVNLVGLAWVSRQRIDTNQRRLNERGKLLGVSMNGLQQIETLKATGAEADFFARWSGYQAKVVNARQDLGVPTTALNVLPTLLTGINTLAILAVGGLRVIEGHLTMGELVAFQALMAAFLTPVNQLLGVGPKLQDAHAEINRLNDVLRNPQESRFSKVPATGDVATPPRLAGHVEIAGVSFGYSRLEPPLIEDFNLRLAPGARVALVGASGSGKSTIARLVAGLYTPWSGEVRFDGQLREAIPEDVMNNSLAVVDQDIFMFEGTVRDNLTLWDTTIREADLLRASRDACIHDDLSGRALGYDASVIEGGANFSGGQRQRLEIARALAGNPRVLIMDEATSALDPQTESRVDQNIRHRGCTCLIVAHRLSTIRDCDEIIVLEHGQVVQRGTHDEMREIDGPYARLIQAS